MKQRNDLAAIAFKGRDAGTFLHNQLTEDVLALEPGDATFAALCQPKGRVMALLMVGATGDGYQVILRASLADGIEGHLRRFIFRDQVTIERAEGAQVLSGEGPDPAIASDANPGFEPVPGFLYGVADGAGAAANEGAEAQEAERARELERGIAWLEPETAEQFLPQMLGHEGIGALNFRKGCFPGQEVIARTRYLGKLKRHPWSGQFEEKLELPPLGDVALTDGEAVASGVLVEQRRREDGSWQAFVVARRPGAIDVNGIVVGDVKQVTAGRWLSVDPEEDAAGA